MAFAFTIRKLKKLLFSEKLIADRGADRFAPGRVKELSEAIEILSNHKKTNKPATETPAPKRTKHRVTPNIKSLFKR